MWETMPLDRSNNLDTPPTFNISEILETIKEKGIRGAMDDVRMGPHVHLFVLLVIIFIITLIIMGVSLVS